MLQEDAIDSVRQVPEKDTDKTSVIRARERLHRLAMALGVPLNFGCVGCACWWPSVSALAFGLGVVAFTIGS
jgi:hypothetical protein